MAEHSMNMTCGKEPSLVDYEESTADVESCSDTESVRMEETENGIEKERETVELPEVVVTVPSETDGTAETGGETQATREQPKRYCLKGGIASCLLLGGVFTVLGLRSTDIVEPEREATPWDDIRIYWDSTDCDCVEPTCVQEMYHTFPAPFRFGHLADSFPTGRDAFSTFDSEELTFEELENSSRYERLTDFGDIKMFVFTETSAKEEVKVNFMGLSEKTAYRDGKFMLIDYQDLATGKIISVPASLAQLRDTPCNWVLPLPCSQEQAVLKRFTTGQAMDLSKAGIASGGLVVTTGLFAGFGTAVLRAGSTRGFIVMAVFYILIGSILWMLCLTYSTGACCPKIHSRRCCPTRQYE